MKKPADELHKHTRVQKNNKNLPLESDRSREFGSRQFCVLLKVYAYSRFPAIKLEQWTFHLFFQWTFHTGVKQYRRYFTEV